MKIVAIGGGELKDLETLKIDARIVELTGKTKPKALFIPTASGEPDGYFESFKSVYETRLGCKTSVLKIIRDKLTTKEIEEQVLQSDLLYVGGGNTLKMMQIWRHVKLLEILNKAAQHNIVLSGLSAGAICWFRYGSSDSRKDTPSHNPLIRIKGLGLINATFSPHHIREKHRDKGLATIMQRTPGVGIAMDDCAAIEILNNEFRIIGSKNGTIGKRFFYKAGKLKIERLEQDSNYKSLDSLLIKS